MENIKEESLYVDENIRLEVASVEYAAALYSIIMFNQEYFSEFMPWPRFVNHKEDTANFLESCLKAHQKDEGKTHIILLDNSPVGMLSFNSIDKKNKTAYIGYWLDRRVQGKGIMTRAIKVLVEYYASHPMINRFVIECSVDNAKSNNVAKRCGFTYVETLKQAECLNNIFHNQNIYSFMHPHI